MLNPAEQELKPLLTKHNDAITALGEAVLEGFSHAISHVVSGDTYETLYILERQDSDDTVTEECISECFINFLSFYIVPNLILPYSATDKQSTRELIRSCKICINNGQNHLTLDLDKITTHSNFDTLALVEVFERTLTQYIAQAVRLCSKNPKKPLTHISFSVMFNMGQYLNIGTLNENLKDNLILTGKILRLCPIVKICNKFPICNIFPGSYKSTLRVTVASDIEKEKMHALICLTTTGGEPKDRVSRMLINLLAIKKYVCTANLYVYVLNDQSINLLPIIQENVFEHHPQPEKKVHTTVCKITPDNSTARATYANIENYISFVHIIFGCSTRVSMKLSLKEEVKAQFQNTAEIPDITDLTTKTNIKDELCRIYFKGETNRMKQLLRRMLISDSEMLRLLQKYNIYIRAEIPYNAVSPQTPRSRSTPGNVIHTTKTEAVTSQDDDKDQILDTVLTIQSQSPKNTRPHTISSAEDLPPVLPIQLPTQPTIEPPHTATKPTSLDKSYSKQITFSIIGISTLAVLGIIAQYTLTNRYLADDPHIASINAAISVGIICCSIIILAGVVLYYAIESHCYSNTPSKDDIELPVQDDQSDQSMRSRF